jgi:hypothetical protein
VLAPAASASAVTVSGPARGDVGQPVAVTLSLPDGVAAIEGRVLVAGAAAEVVGAAPERGTAFRPAATGSGAAVGADALRPRAGRTTVRVVLEPRQAGRLQVRLVLDAAADRAGHRIALGRVSRVVVIRVGRAQRVLRAPQAATRRAPSRVARPTRDLVPDGYADGRDLAAARAAWESAHDSNVPCASTDGDVNRDGCVDIVDMQAVVAAVQVGPKPPQGVRAGLVFTVDSVLDGPDTVPGDGLCVATTGGCTLRAAITEADYRQGADRIEFNLLGIAPVLIQLSSRLPIISSSSGGVTIDGYTQPGSQVNTATLGSNAIPGVEVRGNGSAAKESLFRISSAGNTLRGLLINNDYRAIVVDGPNATGNRIVGNLIGYGRDGTPWLPAARSQFGLVLNAGANHTVVGTPDLADRNVIGTHLHAIENYGPGVADNVIQNNVLCITPSGLATARCDVGIDHNFGPKGNLIGGLGTNERNVVGPTINQAIELSHGWNPALAPRADNALQWQVNGHRILGNWLGFRGDGSYDATFRSGLNRSTADNGNGVNVYDGANNNLVEGNYIASVYDGVQLMAPNAVNNVVRNNVIGVSPLGTPAPLTGWGVKVRWSTQDDLIEGNTIRNAAAGGVGLVQDTVYRIRITRNIVTDTTGPAIDLYGIAGPDPNDGGDADVGANTLLNTPEITTADTAMVAGTATGGATVEIYRASRPVGQFGLPTELLSSVTADGGGNWSAPVALALGDRVTALQIRPDGNTSELAANAQIGGAPPPPQPGDLLASDDFTRTVAGGWGPATLGGTWTLGGTAADFSVDGATGRISTAAGQTREARLAVNRADLALTGQLSFDRLPVTSNAYAYLLARQNGTTAFRVAIRLAPSGAVYAQFKRALANVESNVGTEVPAGLTLAAGQPLAFRLVVVGSHLQLRLWNAAAAEPATWLVQADDTTAALQAAGGIGLRTYTSGSVPNGPVVASLDALELRIP